MSVFQIETSIDIAAPPEQVWKVLTSFASYPQWSRFILSVEGEARPGNQLSVRLDDGGSVMRLRPRVVTREEQTELRWQGSVGATFLFTGEHRFRLDYLPDGNTRFTHSERFSGLLVPFLRKTLSKRTKKAFGDFNAALRQRAEAA